MNTNETEGKSCCRCCDWLQPCFDKLSPLGPLLLRLALGAVFFAHGSQKLFGWFGGHGWNGTMGFMHDKMGIPVFFVVLAMVAEFFGSLGVLFGCLTRLAAFGIFCVMAVAVSRVHLQHGFFADKGGFEYPLTLGLIALSLVITGAGPWSLDALISRCCRKK